MEPSRMTPDDVLFGYRLQLFDLAARTTSDTFDWVTPYSAPRAE
jgi:hypothetical protein